MHYINRSNFETKNFVYIFALPQSDTLKSKNLVRENLPLLLPTRNVCLPAVASDSFNDFHQKKKKQFSSFSKILYCNYFILRS